MQVNNQFGLCCNCARKLSAECRRRGRFVCCQHCGDELAHRLLTAIPDVLNLLPPGTRAQWRDYKEYPGSPRERKLK